MISHSTVHTQLSQKWGRGHAKVGVAVQNFEHALCAQSPAPPLLKSYLHPYKVIWVVSPYLLLPIHVVCSGNGPVVGWDVSSLTR